MTREERDNALKVLKNYDLNFHKINGMLFSVEEIANAFDMAIKALEQEPCEDAISRQEVLYLIADDDLSMGQVVKGIHALPSVTPQPRKGHWISTETKGVRYAAWCRYKCSLCGELSEHANFCPNCGADMRGEEE